MTPRPSRWTCWIAATMALALAAATASCRRDKPTPGAKAARAPVPVEVARVARGKMRQTLTFPGELRAPRAVDVAPKTGGRLEAVSVKMGQRVKKGQLLARIDARELKVQQREAAASLAVSRAAAQRATVDLGAARRELGRKAPLAKKDLVTRQELDNVRAKRDSAEAALAVARAQVSQAQARLSLLRQQVVDATMRAPFDGWIQARKLDPGAMVATSSVILRLVRTDPMVAVFQVGERQVGELRRRVLQGKQVAVTLRLDAFAGSVFSGAVARIAPSLEPNSRAAAVEAELPNADGRLMPGMYCRVSLDLGDTSDALLLPLRALLADPSSGRGGAGAAAQAAQVYVVAGGKARLTAVKLGAIDGRHAEVLDGLRPGQPVVVEGQSRLEDNAPVAVVGAAAGARAADASAR